MNRLPKTKIIFKDDEICRICKGKAILHLGATDAPYHIERAKKGKLLHQEIQKVAKKIIGADFNVKATASLRKFGIKDIYYGDVIKGEFSDEIKGHFDVIIMGDIIEHLDSPGVALENVKRFMSKSTRLIITSPNMHCLHNFKSFINESEDVHPDHMYWPSYNTLKLLIERRGYKIVKFNYCMWGSKEDFKGMKAGLYSAMMKMKPYLASALYFEVRIK